MPRISGINIPEKKQIRIALTYVFGIGPYLSEVILKEADIDPEKRAHLLTGEEANRLKKVIDNGYKVEGNLRREIKQDIKRLKDIGSWRGARHSKNLPVRGQTTKTNSRTVRGNVRRTMGSGRKGAPAPK